ncbi:MAG: hydrogenase maturation protease [Deltaproteobacteria bacterium]
MKRTIGERSTDGALYTYDGFFHKPLRQAVPEKSYRKTRHELSDRHYVKTRPEKKALVLGIGNVLMRDDGAGVRSVESFERLYSAGPEVECLDGGTAGSKLVQVLEGFTHVVIVDAIKDGNGPGTIRHMKASDILKGNAALTTAHGIGVKELLALSAFEGRAPLTTVIGIVPERVCPGLTLTETIERLLPEVASAIASELKAAGFLVKKRV